MVRGGYSATLRALPCDYRQKRILAVVDAVAVQRPPADEEITHAKAGSGTGVVFEQGDQVVSKVLPGFSPSVSEICKHLNK